MYPVTLTGPHIRLREFRTNDLEACMDVVGDPRVTETLSFDTRTRDTHAGLLAADVARAQLAERPDYYLAVANSDDLLIGFARIGLGGRRSGELGYAIRHADWGHGYATEAAQLIMEFGFTQLDLHRIQAACGPENHASQRMLARLGFTPEGRMRDHVHTNGAWRDSLLYSLLAPEWQTTLNSSVRI